MCLVNNIWNVCIIYARTMVDTFPVPAATLFISSVCMYIGKSFQSGILRILCNNFSKSVREHWNEIHLRFSICPRNIIYRKTKVGKICWTRYLLYINGYYLPIIREWIIIVSVLCCTLCERCKSNGLCVRI